MGTTDPAHGPKPDSAGDQYAGMVDRAAIRRGHEADTYDSRSVLSVPALVILFFVLAFGCVSIIFFFVSQSPDQPDANPWAVKQNERPLNERMGDIHQGLGSPVDQPRLEPLRLREGHEKSITSPETTEGNSPELHPEDIVPSKENTPELYRSGQSPTNKAVGQMPIDVAMQMALQGKGELKFPVQKQPSEPPSSSRLPSESNAGRGFGQSSVVLPKLAEEPVPPKTPEGVKK